MTHPCERVVGGFYQWKAWNDAADRSCNLLADRGLPPPVLRWHASYAMRCRTHAAHLLQRARERGEAWTRL